MRAQRMGRLGRSQREMQTQTRGRGRERVAHRTRAEGPHERALQLEDFFQAELGEACELSAGQACAIFANIYYRHVSGKRCGRWWAGGRTPNDRRGMLVNAVRMRAPVHTLADQCG